MHSSFLFCQILPHTYKVLFSAYSFRIIKFFWRIGPFHWKYYSLSTVVLYLFWSFLCLLLVWTLQISFFFFWIFYFIYLFFSFIFISWRLITLQYCSGFLILAFLYLFFSYFNFNLLVYLYLRWISCNQCIVGCFRQVWRCLFW